VYEQIARNKRRTIGYMAVFVLAWLGVGAALGALYAAWRPTAGGGAGGAVITGMVLAAVIAGAAIAFTPASGTRLVLAVAGALPAERSRYPQL